MDWTSGWVGLIIQFTHILLRWHYSEYLLTFFLRGGVILLFGFVRSVLLMLLVCLVSLAMIDICLSWSFWNRFTISRLNHVVVFFAFA